MSLDPIGAAGAGALDVDQGKRQPDIALCVMEAAVEARPQTPGPVDAPPPHLLEPSLFIELDQSAQRFVQMLVDRATGAVLHRYPDDIQLTFSRGIAAYVKASQAA